MADIQTEHTKYMQRCIELANLGKGLVSPNPMVGCVIVHNNKIIGEGYHKKYGRPHAEVNAINSVKEKQLLKNCRLYVNLEPCSHHGKTPPCADLIIKSGIPEVYIGTLDPHETVAGNGVKKLQNAKVKVQHGILEETCAELNKRFFTFHKLKRPYIVLKWAETRDGFIDIKREVNTPNQPTWISNEISRTLVHKWRSEEQAIMIGTRTAEKDNPSLDIRDWEGTKPLRLVIDKQLKLPATLKVFDQTCPTVIFNYIKSENKNNCAYIKINQDQKLITQVLAYLKSNNIISVFIEGGKTLLQSLIDSNTWDEARIFIGNKFFKQGVEAPKISKGFVKETKFDEDTLFIYKNTQSIL